MIPSVVWLPAALAALVSSGDAAKTALKPHFVFFLADDYGFADVSYHAEMYGNRYALPYPPPTPSPDTLL